MEEEAEDEDEEEAEAEDAASLGSLGGDGVEDVNPCRRMVCAPDGRVGSMIDGALELLNGSFTFRKQKC